MHIGLPYSTRAMQYEDDGEFYDEDEMEEEVAQDQEVSDQHNQKQKEL